jgi:ATPases of the AAA+ class
MDSETRLSLTTFEFPVTIENAPVWTPGVAKGLRDVVEEWQHARQLLAAGLEPSKTVLLSGPPGVGKTLAARHLAATLDLPLLTLDLAASISSHLGRTGMNLAQVLHRGQRERCVLFLDEFDALAKSRSDTQDVGELKRVVNVLLQAIDRWPSTSLLVAATNHADLLDHAIFRRFDLWIQFEQSSREQVRELAMKRGCPAGLLEPLVDRLAGRPLSDTIKVMEKAQRLALLRGMELLDAVRESLASLYPDAEGQGVKEDPRAADAHRLQAQGLSQRAIASELGISHSTVHRLLRTVREINHG